MPLRDLPPYYTLDPALQDISARFKDSAVEYLEYVLEHCREHASRDDPNDAISIINDMIAVQVNVSAAELERSVRTVAPESARGKTYDFWVQRVLASVAMRALEAHLERPKTK